MEISNIYNDCILFKCSPYVQKGYNSNLNSTATVFENVPVSVVVKTKKTAKIWRPECGNTRIVKLSSRVNKIRDFIRSGY